MADRFAILPYNHSLAHLDAIKSVAVETLGMPADLDPIRLGDSLALPHQHAWLAFANGQPAGFVSAFETLSLGGSRFEIDLLGVSRSVQGQGLGGALVAQALAGGWAASAARAVVRLDNLPAEAVFLRAGFEPQLPTMDLLVQSPPRPLLASDDADPIVRPATVADLPALARHWPERFPAVERWAELLAQPAFAVLVAWEDVQPRGFVELLEVNTLTYRGAWIEALVAEPGYEDILARAGGRWACKRGLHLIGALVAPDRPATAGALAGLGYLSVGRYRPFSRVRPGEETRIG